jgi:hypothetical protein
MKDGNESALVRVTYGMRPDVAAFGRWMILEIEDLNSPFPHSLALEGLTYGHTLNPCGIAAMQALDDFPQRVGRNLTH